MSTVHVEKARDRTGAGPARALDETRRERLLQIAERCPVHRTLMEEKPILTRLVQNS